jgi:phosphoribosylanthranilate isomerase
MFGNDAARDGRIRVKICGLTTVTDSMMAVDAGADALGFIFYRGSRRFVDAGRARDWMINLPREVAKVAVLVNPTLDDVIQTAALPFIDAIQLHGSESPEFCRRIAQERIRFGKAWPVSDGGVIHAVPNFHTDTIILDSKTGRGFGGTGETFDWSAGENFTKDHPDLRVVVAGGLTVENVRDAIRMMHPYAVDVTTGVESSPGRKDPAKTRAFIAAAREA